ncbi:MAG TPA: hypothetical protein VK721_12585 [Solirubrobacteraceae bacterium]|nr:hypothetical protein [Solirubrobacteraceae bacterium]
MVTADAPLDASLPDALDSLVSASPPDALDSPVSGSLPDALESLAPLPVPVELPLIVADWLDSRLTLVADAARLSAFATSAGSCPEAS